MAGFSRNFLLAYGQAVFSLPFLLLLLLVGIVYQAIYRDPVQAGSFVLRQLPRTLAAGLGGSLLLVIAGIRAEAVTTGWLIPVTAVLALWRPRFICLAYSGSALCLSRLIFGAPAVDVPQLMGLVALLHVVEGLLVLTDRGEGAQPRLVRAGGGAKKTAADKRLAGGIIRAAGLKRGVNSGNRALGSKRRTGGEKGMAPAGAGAPPGCLDYRKRYDLRRFWPLPLVLVTAARLPAAGLPQMSAAVSEMPGWWPLLGRDFLNTAADPAGLGGGLLLCLAPMATVLGFCQSYWAGQTGLAPDRPRLRRGLLLTRLWHRRETAPAVRLGQALLPANSRQAGDPAADARRAALQKAGPRRSGSALLLYSALLFGLCLLADGAPAVSTLQWWPPIFAIGGHELICRGQGR